ncbi:MAG: helix-turn-helix transcriptional regulator [Fusicatenibacter sp.]|nr:AraC family transcriptional regulator [Fusicatenibacter sp.]
MLLTYGLVTVPADWHVTETSPPSYCRAYFVKEGDVIYQDEHTIRRLKHNCLYVFPSTLPYCLKQNPENPLSCHFLHLDIFPHLLTGLLELSLEKDPFLRSLSDTLQIRMENCSAREIDPVLEALSSSLIAYLSEQNLLQAVPEKLAETIAYISEHIREKITLETLSSLCGYHAQYYIRLFTAYMGITPHQYLIRYRMKLGLTLLMSGKSVTETADSVGYPEVRNFIRAFHKYYGYSPLKVQKLVHPEP